MKKVILLIALTLGALQADNIVHYDTQGDKGTQISKPNYPSQDIYPTN
ncbi:hypothetical protein [Sulfurimonas sp.]|nr:hypothetical protein [Sulfurimonas sp.]MDD5157912.1 hypothetical protein [Sulfurimonas sp.]